MYHMISKTDHKSKRRYAVSLSRFERQMSYLKSNGYTAINLDFVHGCFMNKECGIPEKPVVLTFDDGYIEHYEYAFPVLRQHNFPAIFFVIAGDVGKTNKDWKFRDYPERRLIGWPEIEEMKGSGMTIGSHSITHPFLTKLSYEDAVREIEGSRKYLEDKTGTPIENFTYPYGDYNEVIIDIVKNHGYKTACSTLPGFNTEKDNIFELRRLDIYGSDTLLQFAIKLALGINEGNLLIPAKRYLKSAMKKILEYKQG